MKKQKRNQKKKILILFSIGFFLFLSIVLILLLPIFNSQTAEVYFAEEFVIANVRTQSVDLYWKGYSKESNFRILFKESKSTAPAKEITPRNIYENFEQPNSYVYNINLSNLKPNEEYLIELWHGATLLDKRELTTMPIQEELYAPDPISGGSFVFDWMKISNEESTHIVRADERGNWVLDRNLIGSNYKVEIYSSSLVKRDNPISSYLSSQVYAQELANCDEITYSGIASNVKSKAARFQELLKLNGGSGGNPQYLRCYHDVYCESDKAGVNARWSLANWSHESNASDYEYPGSSAYADFGVRCCGVPVKNFQHQFGFFLNLSHNPCECDSGCSKEQYYCCWANNYLLGTKSLQCTDQSRSYLNSLMSYYYWVSTDSDPGTFEGRLKGLPSRIKTSGKSVSCGPTNPIDIFNGGELPPPKPPDDEGENLCCALKISNKENFVGDFESNVSGGCDDVWKIGRTVHGGKLQYSVELPSKSTRSSCEKDWKGVCCRDSGELNWVPETLCRKKVSEYRDYNSCITATEGFDRCCAIKVTGKDDFQGSFSSNVTEECDRLWPRGKEAYGGKVEYTFELDNVSEKKRCEKTWEGVCCKDSGEYEWLLGKNCNTASEHFTTYEECQIARKPLKKFSVSLNKGYNFVSWIGEDVENPLKASELLSKSPVILVAGFNDGVWDRLIYKEDGEVKGNDFILNSKEAYLLTSLSELDIEYKGREFTDFDWNNMKGWQLVPSAALEPYRTTKSVVLSFETVDVSQIALWNKSVGRFDYYVYSTLSGKQYGESVTLNKPQGVFVRIE